MNDAAEITLTLAALVLGLPLAFGLLLFAANMIYLHVVPRLLIAPASYPARAVAWLMVLGFLGLFGMGWFAGPWMFSSIVWPILRGL
ncbi:hypothetical protein [Paludisphaera soli]|uniref:hypothetical protein n=1 Tax=Paludisphaera soli TaxID=2712865 RepID=UPI0013E9D307|nr:hypothetical protein [Paludisphaera soli]